jgi:tRNA 2-thiouridine synthesizing protein E
MPLTMKEVLIPSLANRNRAFPDAPEDWTIQEAENIAKQQGIALSEDHLRVVRALQEYSSKHKNEKPNVRELHDALDENFHRQGGIKYLYGVFPGGPVAQGYLIAGIEPPANATNKSFGSVQ